MSELIEVNTGYHMMMADSFKAFFATHVEEGWQVLSVDLALKHPNEQGRGIYESKVQAIETVEQLVELYQSNRRTRGRRVIHAGR